MTYLGRIFRGYAVEQFGEQAMANITDEQVEEARVMAFKVLEGLTYSHGRQSNGTCKNLFLTYLNEVYMKKG